MNEVISISASHHANHVLASLYNNQESHLPYSPKAPINHWNQVFLNANKLPNGRTNYSPRVIIYELTGGLGSYSPFKYFENAADISGPTVIETGIKVPKNDYQKQLDNGKPTDPTTLTDKTVHYWSDYNKMIYKPTSLVTLSNWNHEVNGKGHHRLFPNIEFNYFHQGVEEYKEVQDDTIEEFRKNLENCDLVQGCNFLSDIDSSWGGFTNSLITDIKDEFFNNGINNKYNLWTYTFSGKTPTKLLPTLNKIKSLVEFSKNSSLVLPLSLDTSSLLLNSDFNPDNFWHRGAIESVFINSLWGLNNTNDTNYNVKMATIEDELLRGYNDRNIVNEINIHQLPTQDDHMSYTLQSVNIMDYYNPVPSITSPPTKPGIINLGLNKKTNEKSISKSFIVPDNSSLELESSLTTHVYTNPALNDITKVDTFPSILELKQVYIEMNQSSALKNDFKEYRKIISRVRPGSGDVAQEIIEDKQELMEDLSNIIEEYIIGYEDESDEEFD